MIPGVSVLPSLISMVEASDTARNCPERERERDAERNGATAEKNPLERLVQRTVSDLVVDADDGKTVAASSDGRFACSTRRDRRDGHVVSYPKRRVYFVMSAIARRCRHDSAAAQRSRI